MDKYAEYDAIVGMIHESGFSPEAIEFCSTAIRRNMKQEIVNSNLIDDEKTDLLTKFQLIHE